MENNAPFGVDQSEVINAIETSRGGDSAPEVTDSAPPSSHGENDLKSDKTPEARSTETTLVDLDKLQRFRFAGREWAPKELHTAHMLQQDYSRKMQAIAETRKYADNFAYDLSKVIEKPELLSELKRVYPKEYHAAAERALSRFTQQQSGTPNANNAPTQLDPRILRELEELKSWRNDTEQRTHQAEVQAKEQWLENQFNVLQKKYPMANVRAVMSDANALLEMEQAVNEKVLDKLFQQAHKESEGLFKAHYKSKVEQQLKQSAKGKDVQRGGGTPGSAPRVAKSIEEATKFYMEDLKAQQRS